MPKIIHNHKYLNNALHIIRKGTDHIAVTKPHVYIQKYRREITCNVRTRWCQVNVQLGKEGHTNTFLYGEEANSRIQHYKISR